MFICYCSMPSSKSLKKIILYASTIHFYCLKPFFNKKACEQLNAWLGGFESILKCMVPGNFDWFLHTMLFYHTRYVLKKQHKKREDEVNNDDDESDDDAEVEA